MRACRVRLHKTGWGWLSGCLEFRLLYAPLLSVANCRILQLGSQTKMENLHTTPEICYPPTCMERSICMYRSQHVSTAHAGTKSPTCCNDLFTVIFVAAWMYSTSPRPPKLDFAQAALSLNPVDSQKKKRKRHHEHESWRSGACRHDACRDDLLR